MNIEIRNAIYEDKDILNEMLEKLIRYEYDHYNINVKEDFKITSFFDKKLKEDNSIVLVACYNNNIIGYIYAYIDSDNIITKDLEAFVNSLYIEEDYRNKKNKNKLIKELIEVLKRKDVKFVSIDNMVNNIEAR